jgi:sugar lactone lactonase YvrE
MRLIRPALSFSLAVAVGGTLACSDDQTDRSSAAPLDAPVSAGDGGPGVGATAGGAVADGGADDAGPDGGSSSGPTAELELVHSFKEQMPTGVAVSKSGRIFVNYPRWDDPIRFTVAEIKGDAEIAYPDQAANEGESPDRLFSVQSVVIDAKDRLWALDTGSINMGPPDRSLAKLVAFDLAKNQVVKTIRFPADVLLPTTYLNDVRFDLGRGAEGTAFITDSSSMGENAIIVVDLASGTSRRRLRDDPSVKPDPGLVPDARGAAVMVTVPPPPMPLRSGVDGIALSGDGTRIFYCPLTSRRLHSVSVDALLDFEHQSDFDVAKTIETETRDFFSDGLFADAQGRVYLTDYEHTAVWVRNGAGQFTELAQESRILWPDSLALGADGSLYVTMNQLQLQPKYQFGKDKRLPPYELFRIRTDSRPIGK